MVSDGEHYTLPYTGEGSWGLGKPLKSITHPLRDDLPIFLGAEGPKNVAMTAEIADGWLPLYYSPYRQDVYADQIAHAKPGFEIMQGVSVIINDDVEAALQPIKQNLALYVGGMGAKSRNFHNELIKRMGFEEAAEKIQGGNLKPIQFLMGQVMKATRGKANPKLVQELIKKQLVQ